MCQSEATIEEQVRFWSKNLIPRTRNMIRLAARRLWESLSLLFLFGRRFVEFVCKIDLQSRPSSKRSRRAQIPQISFFLKLFSGFV